jgi:hypothetical protein
MTKAFETRCSTIINRGNGSWTVLSDGLLEAKEWLADDLHLSIHELAQEGWSLVGCMDRHPNNGEVARMELFFRRPIPG